MNTAASAQIAMQFPDLRGRAVVVTGAGRSRGIGAAICRAFADQGCNIFFTTNTSYDSQTYPDDPVKSGAGQLAEELRRRAVLASYIEADLAQPNCAEQILNGAQELFGAPSILVNNAAHFMRDGFEKLDARALDTHYAVNVRGAALLSVEFARRFSGKVGGRIIYLTSGQDLSPMPGQLAYVASKGAITAFMRSFAQEVGRKGITVNAVDPGPTETGWMSEDLKASLIGQSVVGRLGRPDDAARMVVFLASAAAEWISGEVIHARGI
jgi:3-oxoacyl-[acyl-carrier protein] reductase